MTTQRFSLVIRHQGETIVRGVDWPLDGLLRDLLAVELRARSLSEALAWQLHCEDLPLDLSLSVADALHAAGIPLSPDKPLRAFAQSPDTPSQRPPAAPSAPPAPVVRPASTATGSAPGMPPGPPPSSPAGPSSFGAPPSPFGAPPSPFGSPPPFGPPPPFSSPSLPSPMGPAHLPPASMSSPGGFEAMGRVSSAALPTEERRATVRYFTKMNPQRVFPLVVTIAPYAALAPEGPNVARAVGEKFALEGDALVEIEPVLPGCTVHPPKMSVNPRAGVEVKAEFWVVPQVMGKVLGATVYVRHAQRTMRVPLKVSVAQPRAAQVSGALGLVVPYGTAVMKHYHLDFESQLGEGFSLYLAAARAVLFTLHPSALFALFAAMTLALWLWARPRQTVAHEDPDALLAAGGSSPPRTIRSGLDH